MVYQYRRARCNSCYVGRTHKHLTTRIGENLDSESSSIFKHLLEKSQCKSNNIESNFKSLDNTKSQYELAVKEGLYINWLRPNLNKQKIAQSYYTFDLTCTISIYLFIIVRV